MGARRHWRLGGGEPLPPAPLREQTLEEEEEEEEQEEEEKEEEGGAGSRHQWPQALKALFSVIAVLLSSLSNLVRGV